MKTSKKVFVAGNVFFAFVDRGHPKHEHAAAYFRYFGIEHYQVYTGATNMMDAYSLIYARMSPSLGKDFLRTMMLGNINILYPLESDYKAALKALTAYRSTELTYPQAITATLAKRNNIGQICTFEFLHSLFGLETFYLPI